MTSSLTISEERDRPKFVLASAAATLTLSGGASVLNVLCSVNGQAAVLGAGGFFLRTRSLCTLSAICCSNEQIYAGFEARLDNWRPSSVSLDKKRRGGTDGNG